MTINNAGMGLYISSEIMKRIRGNMYIVSGNGVVHISPTDTTSKKINSYWPGTFVKLAIKLGEVKEIDSVKLLENAREEAKKELKEKAANEYVVKILNIFGTNAESKTNAIKFRDEQLMPEINSGKCIILDFKGVESAPHSFINALLATPAKACNLFVYHRIKVINCISEIRETIDFVFEENSNTLN